MNTVFTMPQKKILALVSILLFSMFINIDVVLAQDGAKIFKQNCAVCHSLTKKKITGPGLEGIAGRASDEWLAKWIKNNKAVIASGDAYAASLNPTGAMPSFTHLGDDEIAAVIDYIKNPPVVVKPAGQAVAASSTGAPADKGIDPLGVLLGVIAFAFAIIVLLRGVRHTLKNQLNAKNGLPVEEKKGFFTEVANWINGHRALTAIIILVIVAFLLSAGWNALKGIGIYEGYHPTQPIAFSHKIHAGDNAIDCQYCHSGVEKSKSASIPSVNVCMNCHKGISEGPSGPKGTAEINKIYEAAGFDGELGEYTKEEKPIKWVKVHNLPDFVFFSHQQHVKVGKQDCANCHGDVKEMTTVKQVKPLTMAWCIDCHRTTEVPGMQDNPYYERLHSKLSEKFKDQPITVDKMGGIECAKCHY